MTNIISCICDYVSYHKCQVCIVILIKSREETPLYILHNMLKYYTPLITLLNHLYIKIKIFLFYVHESAQKHNMLIVLSFQHLSTSIVHKHCM